MIQGFYSLYSLSTHFLLETPVLFALLDPVLNCVSHARDLFVDVLSAGLGVDLGHLQALEDVLARPDVGLGDDGELLLVLPEQTADVVHGDGEDEPAGADAEGEGGGGAEQDVAVAADDAAGHARDQDVDEARHELLAALAGGRQ